FTIKDPNATCKQQGDSGSISNCGVEGLHSAWSLIRNIVSALLIILMLVMVISQAIGSGPFDAYTVKKVMPKLVAAIILMQLSWAITIWVINVVDDLGRSLANIMYAPFGGAKQMDLNSLMVSAHIGDKTAATFSWILLLGVIIAAFIALPAVILFCFIAIMAIATGLLVLIFRKIIIIMALLFVPLALLAWILPGTQRFYKMWSENFIKALLMFPIAVAIIAAGRIFAKVASFNDTGTLINFLIVLVGFFGPLFILPKTFRWGGGLMNLAGQG